MILRVFSLTAGISSQLDMLKMDRKTTGLLDNWSFEQLVFWTPELFDIWSFVCVNFEQKDQLTKELKPTY